MIKAGPADKELVLDLLTYAFEENLSVKNVVKPKGNHWENVYALMLYAYKLCSLYGDIFLSEDKKACAFILYPDQRKNTVKTRLWELQLMFEGIGLSKANKVSRQQKMLDSILPDLNGHPYLYLWLLGVKPEHQFLGSGTKLLKDLLLYSERKNRAMCLRTSSSQNMNFYKKFGFEVYSTLNLGYELNFLWKTILSKQQTA